jgi:hypothetical protein
MKPIRLPSTEARAGMVLSRDVRAGAMVLLAKGRLLTEQDVRLLRDQPASEVHAAELEPGDVHEDPAGLRLAAAASGEGVDVQPLSGGTLPLAARWRGIVEVDAAKLAALNAIDDLAVTTLPPEQIVTEGEVIARAKIVPFVTREERIAQAERAAAGGVISIRRFVPLKVAAVVEDRLDAASLDKFRRDFDEKVRFFGSTLLPPALCSSDAESIAGALRQSIVDGAQLVLVAAGRAMDPLDPALVGLAKAGGKLLRNGIPAHPGALLWLGALNDVPVVGVPSCGVASKPTALDQLLPRLFAGERASRELMVALGAGGMITRDNAFRLPPYRRPGARGELDPS